MAGLHVAAPLLAQRHDAGRVDRRLLAFLPRCGWLFSFAIDVGIGRVGAVRDAVQSWTK
jgi:hypothetical protein